LAQGLAQACDGHSIDRRHGRRGWVHSEDIDLATVASTGIEGSEAIGWDGAGSAVAARPIAVRQRRARPRGRRPATTFVAHRGRRCGVLRVPAANIRRGKSPASETAARPN
jgi:hypothetical protein